MYYDLSAIPDAEVPQAVDPIFQHVLITYASEANKTASVWRAPRTTCSISSPTRGRTRFVLSWSTNFSLNAASLPNLSARRSRQTVPDTFFLRFSMVSRRRPSTHCFPSWSDGGATGGTKP
jgi:hypothetical protein